MELPTTPKRLRIDSRIVDKIRSKVDEIVVLDSFSTDRTVEIVARATALAAAGKTDARQDEMLHYLGTGDEKVGRLTSGGYSVVFTRSIGMGYVPPGVGDAVEVDVRARSVPARIVALPFYREGSVRRRRVDAPARSTAR